MRPNYNLCLSLYEYDVFVIVKRGISNCRMYAFTGSVSKSVSGRNSKKGPAKILTGPNKFVILGDKT